MEPKRRENLPSKRTRVDKTRKQRMERSRRERFNTSMSELQGLLSQNSNKDNDATKMDQTEVLDQAVNFLRCNTRESPATPRHEQEFMNGYNACAMQFIDFLICEDGVSADGKAKILSDLADVLCGAASPSQKTPAEPTELKGCSSNTVSNVTDKEGELPSPKLPLPRLPKQRNPLSTIENRQPTPYPKSKPASNKYKIDKSRENIKTENNDEIYLPPVSVFLKDI